MDSIIMYNFKNERISIEIKAYFEEDDLIIEGYDIGSAVEEAWGDSDYEYSTTISRDEVTKLFPLFQVKEGDKEGLLKAITVRFNSNTCYSEFGKFLRENRIQSEGFTWS